MGGLLTSFQQSIYEQSLTKKHRFGMLRIDDDGRKFRYARAGATALVAGKVGTGANAGTVNIALTPAAAAVWVREISVTLGAEAVTANEYDDGLLQVYDTSTGTAGEQYRISSHGTSTTGSAAINISLREPIRVAVLATDSVSLVPNPWNGVTETAAVAGFFAGVAPIAVTAAYYYWAQTGGEAIALNTGNTALGGVLEMSATAGSYKIAANYLGGLFGQSYSYASVNTKYCPVYLSQD
jgi:hypothetical protein